MGLSSDGWRQRLQESSLVWWLSKVQVVVGVKGAHEAAVRVSLALYCT